MEKLFIKEPSFQFEKIYVKVRIMPALYIGIRGVFKTKDYLLGDFSYGEFIIYQNDRAKYYFSILDQYGNENKIVQCAAKRKLPVDIFLLNLLKNEGYKNLSLTQRWATFIYFEKHSYMADIPLLQIVDA